MIIKYPPDYPKSVHLYITNECNLDCESCYYRSSSDPKKELSFEQIKILFEEWKKFGLKSIAIGGGEPLLHPDIDRIVLLAKEMGFFIAVTTNGTILRPIAPNRVHISYDELHPTWKNERLIQKAINYYHDLGCTVGINHIVTNLENINYIDTTFDNATNLLLIRQKPESQFTQWSSIPYRKNYWIEGCLEGSVCEQGILSFHLNYDMKASICSNLKKKLLYTNLQETWAQLKKFECEIRDSNMTGDFNKNNFKIYNSEVVDCSTGFVNIIPDESSLRILLDMVKTIVESDFIKAIGDFDIHFQGNVGSLVKYESPYVCEDYGYNEKYYESYRIIGKDINKQNSTKSRDDKIYGLYVETFKSAKTRKEDENMYVIPPGLTGVEEALQVIYTILDKDFVNYPPHIPHKLDTIVFLSLSIEVGFVEGNLFMERIVVDSRRNLISIIFNSDGLPLPEEEYDKPVFSFIGKNLDNILQVNWPELYMLDYVWGDDDLMFTKKELKSIDKRHKLNLKAFFIDCWYLPILKELIQYDIQSNNIIAIYDPIGVPNELWVVVNSLENLPKIDTFGVHIITIDNVDFDKLKVKDLLYGAHVTNKNI